MRTSFTSNESIRINLEGRKKVERDSDDEKEFKGEEYPWVDFGTAFKWKKNALRDRDESDDVDKFAAKQKYFWDLEIKVYS